MSVHRYPADALTGDYARALGGIVVTALPLPWLTDHPVPFTVLSVLAIAFLIFAVSTVDRQRMVVEVDASGIATSGLWRRSLPWSELQGLRLRYFSTRRDREKGWMQLTLDGGRRGAKVRVDSQLDGFHDVAVLAARAARTRDLVLDDATEANLAGIGLGREAR